MKLFDTHCHLFERGWKAAEPGVEAAHYTKLCGEFGITRSLVIGFEGASRFAGNNDYIAGAALGRPDLIPVPYVDPMMGGIGVGGAAISMYLRDPRSARRACDELDRRSRAGMATRLVSLNAVPEALGELVGLMARHDRTWFLISHLGLPGASSAGPRLAPVVAAGQLPNVTIKLSGQYAASAEPKRHPHTDVAPIIDLLAEACGVETLVWGSDYSPVLDFVSFEEAVNCLLPSGISADERRGIAHDSASSMCARFVESS